MNPVHTSIDSVGGAIFRPSPITEGPKSKDPVEAAQQFEAILLGQMLQEMRPAGESEDQTNDTMWDMAAQQFAQVLAKNGGMGLAKMIQAGLKPALSSPTMDPTGLETSSVPRPRP
jgi:Rod binding domain-containing protein